MADFGQTTLPGTGDASGAALAGYVYFAGGIAPEAGTLDSATIRVVGNASAASAYMGVYKGSSSTTIEGSTLIAKTAEITDVIGGTATNFTKAFRTDDGLSRTFAAGDRIWLAVLIVANADRFSWRKCNSTGDWSIGPDSRVWGYMDTSGQTSLPATAGTDTGYPEATTMASYLTYTAGGASAVPAIASFYQMLRSA